MNAVQWLIEGSKDRQTPVHLTEDLEQGATYCGLEIPSRVPARVNNRDQVCEECVAALIEAQG